MTVRHIMTSDWRAGLFGAALVALTGLCCWALPLGLVNLSYDLAFFFRDDISVDGAVMIYMDPESEAKLEQLRRATWDRALHARLLDRLKDFHPSAVVFDVLFQTTTNDPTADHELVRAASAFGKVVVAAKPTPDIYEGEILGWGLT